MLLLHSFILLCVMALASCTFTPIYQQDGAAESLRNISVVTPASREGQLFRIALEDALRTQTTQADNVLILNATIAIDAQPLSIEADGTTQRYRLLGNSRITLTDPTSNERLYTTTIERISSYNISDADYSTYISGQYERNQLINAIAETARLRLLTYLGEG